MRTRSDIRLSAAIVAIAGVCLTPTAGCKLHRKLPWVSTESIVNTDPGLPPIALVETQGLHTVVMRAPSGGWTVGVDKAERTPEGMRLYVTARRPDPAFYHTQALVDLHALSDVPAETPVTVVGRLLDHDADPKDRIYGSISPLSSLD